MIKKIIYKVASKMSEGHFVRYIFDELDELIWGRFGRFLIRILTPVKDNKIFFHTQENRYACNPKYICEEFRRRRDEEGLDVELVWRIGKQGGGIPNDCRSVIGNTAAYYKELFSSRYVIANSVLYVKSGFRLKKSQVVFQTWHGSLGIKNFGKKDYKGGYHWVRGAIATGKMTDYCITNSSFVSKSLANTYWEKTPKLEYGHPRNDIMFENYAAKRAQVKKDFLKAHNIPEDAKFVMYGPTFRDSKNFDIYSVDYKKLQAALAEKFGGTWYVLLRFHPSLWDSRPDMCMKSVEGVENLINVTSYTDMQELMTIADIAITDYSSWIYDFMLQRRPGFIYAVDIKLYNNERGLNYPLETTPFPIATNNKELIEAVKNFDEEQYLVRLEEFLADKGCIEDGHASERTVDKILELMEKRK